MPIHESSSPILSRIFKFTWNVLLLRAIVASITLSILFPFSALAFDIIAHRGASGFLPEHTLEAAVYAHAQGPDYIEQDIVLSKDAVPVVLHDIHLETVTDVETQFPNRHRADGRWYAIDFTLAELKQLHVHERENTNQETVFANRYSGAGHFTIATFEEHITTILSLNRTTGQNIGLYPEIKSPAFHRQAGLNISEIVITMLNQYGLNNYDANIIVQCFDFAEIKYMRSQLGLKTKLVQLIAENEWHESPSDYDYLKSPQGLAELSRYVNGIGPWYAQLISLDNDGNWQSSVFATALRNSQLTIHPYTFRSDALPNGVNTNDVLDTLNTIGVDGIFTDQVPPVKHWRQQLKND